MTQNQHVKIEKISDRGLTKIDNEQRHIEEIQEIIGVPPAWIVRWGISIYLLIMAIILSISSIINYPDVVNAELTITSTDVPKPIAAQAPGRLDGILVENNKVVKAGQPLAIVSNQNGNTLIKAPFTGILTFAGIVHKNESVFLNQTLFYITAGNADNLFGEVKIPPASIAKVKKGQAVMVKLVNYPYEEYGILHGKVNYVTTDALNGNTYLAEISFDTKNVTDMHKKLDLRRGMTANAEIIIEKSTLLKRITSTLFKKINY